MDLGAQSCRELVQRVLATDHFNKSARLRDFLSYVAERALADPKVRLHEEEIAAKVFGRPLDPQGGDTIVRVHASQLRKRLQQYFAGEGAEEPILIELPTGNYAPVFRRREPEWIPSLPVIEALPKTNRLNWALGGICVMLAVLAAYLAVENRSISAASSPIPPHHRLARKFWTSLVGPERHSDIVLADSSLSLFADLIHRPLTLAEYLTRDYSQFTGDLASNRELEEFARTLMKRQNTTIGDANLAHRLGALGGREDRNLTVHYARDYHIRNFNANNVILVGARRANPWVELIEDHLKFRFGYNEKERLAFIENHSPRPGEQTVYNVRREAGRSRQGYAVIAFVPNPSGNGKVLYIAGTEMEGTEACGDFLTNEHWMSRLPSLGGGSEGVPYFELLLRTTVVGGAAPEFDIVSYETRK